MLTAEDLKVVLASAPLRQAHGLELPQDSLTTLAGDPGAFANFYQQWSAQGQPRYVPPAAAQTPAPNPVRDAASAPVAVQDAIPPLSATPPVPVPPLAATPALVPPSPFGPPPTPHPAPQFSPYSRDPAAAASASATPAPPYAGSPYSGSPYPNPYAGADYLNSPNAVAPGGLARPGMSMMLWGFGVAVVGIVVTGVTWAAAAPGGTFVVAWGAIIFGTIRGIIGAVKLNRG